MLYNFKLLYLAALKLLLDLPIYWLVGRKDPIHVREYCRFMWNIVAVLQYAIDVCTKHELKQM